MILLAQFLKKKSIAIWIENVCTQICTHFKSLSQQQLSDKNDFSKNWELSRLNLEYAGLDGSI